MADFAFLDWPGPLAFAHQGAHRPGGPGENTMAAFEAALVLGCRYLETDVHATADGMLVAFHDDRLDRLTDKVGAIAELPWSEVAAARVRGGEHIPLLEDVLTTWPGARVNIDPKHDGAVDPLIEVIRRTKALDRVCIGAFSDKRIDRLQQELGPELCTSMGPKQVARLVGTSRGLRVGRFSAACVQVPTRTGPVPLVTPRFVATAHELGKQVHVWTVDDPAEMHRLLDMGVDGIMTDRTDLLKAVLIDRGAWVDAGPMQTDDPS